MLAPQHLVVFLYREAGLPVATTQLQEVSHSDPKSFPGQSQRITSHLHQRNDVLACEKQHTARVYALLTAVSVKHSRSGSSERTTKEACVRSNVVFGITHLFQDIVPHCSSR